MKRNNSVVDVVKLPFLLADKIASPAVKIVEENLGEEIKQIVAYVPGLTMIEEMCEGFNSWVNGSELPPSAGSGKLPRQDD